MGLKAEPNILVFTTVTVVSLITFLPHPHPQALHTLA